MCWSHTYAHNNIHIVSSKVNVRLNALWRQICNMLLLHMSTFATAYESLLLQTIFVHPGCERMVVRQTLYQKVTSVAHRSLPKSRGCKPQCWFANFSKIENRETTFTITGLLVNMWQLLEKGPRQGWRWQSVKQWAFPINATLCYSTQTWRK